MRAQSVKAYIRLLSGVTVSTSSPGFPRAERRARKLKLGTGDERRAQVGHDGNQRITRVFSAFSQSHLSIRPRFLNYQPKYPQNKRSPAIKDEVDFPLLSPLRALRPIGTLRSNVATATKTSLKKWINLCSFSLYCNYYCPLTLSNVSETSWSWIPRENIQVQREK